VSERSVLIVPNAAMAFPKILYNILDLAFCPDLNGGRAAFDGSGTCRSQYGYSHSHESSRRTVWTESYMAGGSWRGQRVGHTVGWILEPVRNDVSNPQDDQKWCGVPPHSRCCGKVRSGADRSPPQYGLALSREPHPGGFPLLTACPLGVRAALSLLHLDSRRLAENELSPTNASGSGLFRASQIGPGRQCRSAPAPCWR
jgi:hypothetical protein